jgi:hypothetical protein
VHEPPRHVLGFVYPVSVDAAPLCFCDAAYDALGTETIAANAMAASTLIFEAIRIPPTRVAVSPTHAAYRVSRDPRLSMLAYSRHPATAILANVWRRNRSYVGVIVECQRRYLGQIGSDRHVERLLGYWWFAAELAVKDFGAAAKRMKVEIVAADERNKTDPGGQ